jgi:hypothetical protein
MRNQNERIEEAYRERPRQEFHNPRIALGASHVLKLAGALSPLLILEFVKEPTKAHRWIRIASITAAGINETLWAMRVQRRSEEQRHR